MSLFNTFTKGVRRFGVTKVQKRVFGAQLTVQDKSDRLFCLMDHYSDKNAGMWNELYHARVEFKDFFESGCDSDEGRIFVKNWCTLRSYICSRDGLSDIEREAIVLECSLWCPSLSKDELRDICNKTAALDGLSDNELDAFEHVGSKLQLSKDVIFEAYECYQDEVKLKKKYQLFYQN
mmetsp:Transcript_43202/g.53071  ORF Transcript_43202/g.53071 Transcript_43202/m.53071 type:complete len:178 (+) Transcript_43202:1057-1590(+)